MHGNEKAALGSREGKMIEDIFEKRYDKFNFKGENSFFVQLFNLYDSPELGIKKILLEKIEDYPYSTYADEHIRIISQSMKKLCNELGLENLNKSEYKEPSYGYEDYRVFKNFIYDESVNLLSKLSLFEIIFRDTEKHLLNEICFAKDNIPKYKEQLKEIEEKILKENIRYHNEGREKLEKILPLLEEKEKILIEMKDVINQRLGLSNIGLSYRNGFFQFESDEILEEKIEKPFWNLLANPKYKNVETDILEALNRYDKSDRDSAFYAAKALESMIKIVCEEKKLVTGRERGAGDFISHLNSKGNGKILLNEEKEELVSMFRIRNTYGHGPGSNSMPNLTSTQEYRYIRSAMVWIYSLSER